MIVKDKIMDTKYHSLYGKKISTVSVPEIKERYNHKKKKYEPLWGYEKYLYRWNSYLKAKKIIHAIVFNRFFFWRKPIFRLKKDSYLRYRLYVGAFHSDEKELHSLFYQLREASSLDILELVISSNGGSIDEGQQFFNFIKEKFHNQTTAYLDNSAYSMGATLFCMADKRVIYPYSELMFHNYSTRAGGKGGEIKARIEHRDKYISKFRHDMVVKQGFLTQEEFEQLLIGQDYWMDSQELCRRGIATHVMVDGKEIEADEYLKEIKCKNTTS